jgi:uncharacterized protein
MLTKEHAIATFDFQQRLILPDRLTTLEHARYHALAEKMLAVYQQGIGRRRRDLHHDIHQLFDEEPDCPVRRIEAFCKLLDDESTYASAARKNAATLRCEVFRKAARFHPLVLSRDALFEATLHDVQQNIAGQLNREWSQIADELFADVMEFHRLKSFAGYPTPRALLSRYNVAQVQAALFNAVSMTVRASADFKRILRAARLASLMHTITCPQPGSYRIELTGPASVLRETRRYGVNMAKFLPALIACSNWSMEAVLAIRSQRCHFSLVLSSEDKLRSHLPADTQFDSAVEAAFYDKWGTEPRNGWRLMREADILHSGQKTFVPDFVLQHESGRRVLLEIVGFWTPEYILNKLESLQVFHDIPIILAIAESTAAQFAICSTHATIVRYKTALLVKQVQDVLPVLPCDH